jgi:pilus assembly protein CpaE
VATSEQIRLLLVEDVAQVSQYVRNLLQHQKQVRLLDTVTDGRVVLDRVRELRPDVLMVDALLQGKASGLEVAEQVRQAGLRIPIIIVTVPQKPVKVGEGMGIIEVLSMPFSGFELMNAVNHASSRYRATAPSAMSRAYVVYSGKGGVGRTTIAYNLAVSFGQMPGVRAVLIDGDLQFSDLRGLLRVPDTAPSLLQLPTDRIAESDLASVLWRDPSGIDLLLAPPRVEQAEMVTARDVEKVMSLLRRIYNHGYHARLPGRRRWHPHRGHAGPQLGACRPARRAGLRGGRHVTPQDDAGPQPGRLAGHLARADGRGARPPARRGDPR